MKAIEAEAAARARGIGATAEADAIAKIDTVKLKSEKERADIEQLMPPVGRHRRGIRGGLANAKIGSLNLGPDTMQMVGETLAKAMADRKKS